MKKLFRIYKLFFLPIWFIIAFLAKFPLHIWHFYYRSIFISKLPFIAWDCIRYWFYKYTLTSVWNNVTFMYGVIVQSRNTCIWNNVFIWFDTIIWECCIGNDVMFGTHCTVIPWGKGHGFHNVSTPMRLQKWDTQKISIGNDVWVWSNATIMADVGDGVVVGACSNVVKSVSDFDIVVWNPNKVIGNRKIF